MEMKFQNIKKILIKDKYLIASLIMLFIVIIAKFRPWLIGNETVSLIASKRICEPDFLVNDWAFNSTKNIDIKILFNILMAPLWLLFDFLSIAFIGRLLTWSLLIFSIINLSKVLEIKWRCLIIGFLFWLYLGQFGQSIAAGGWIFGGVEPKCFSYAFLLLAMASLLREKIFVGSIYCGLAVFFHVIVGGWGLVALFFAMLFSFKEYGKGKLLEFCFCSFLFSMPIIMIAFFYLKGPTAIVASKSVINNLSVLFRNPHHLDPLYFLSLKKIIFLILLFMSTIIMFISNYNKREAKFFIVFLSVLMLIFTAGILARGISAIWFLKFYPFRLGGIFLLFFFCLNFPKYLFQKERINYIRQAFSTMRFFPYQNIFSIFILILVVYMSFNFDIGGKFIKDIKEFTKSWYEYGLKNKGFNNKDVNFAELTNWIKNNTNRGDIFVVPPDEFRFWLWAERACFFNFKCCPANVRIIEWYNRLLEVNGKKKIKKRGFEVLDELKKNYLALSKNQLEDIKNKHYTNYYLTTVQRADLEKNLIYMNSGYYLYNI